MKQPSVAVIRHLAFEGPGTFGRTLADAGFELDYLDAGQGRIDTGAAVDADLLLVLGGPIGVGDENEFPVLRQELDAIGRRLDDRRPILAICLGAQLVAHALGARTTPGPPEIEWSSLKLTEDGLKSPLRHLDSPVLHWHSDRFELPGGAVRLASTDSTPNQAFVWQNTLAMQFHPEVTAGELEPWYIGHHRGIIANELSVPALRAAAERHADRLAEQARRMLIEWLESVGLLVKAR
jgi:GMP synthase (glutamine-hydrolysing)